MKRVYSLIQHFSLSNFTTHVDSVLPDRSAKTHFPSIYLLLSPLDSRTFDLDNLAILLLLWPSFVLFNSQMDHSSYFTFLSVLLWPTLTGSFAKITPQSISRSPLFWTHLLTMSFRASAFGLGNHERNFAL